MLKWPPRIVAEDGVKYFLLSFFTIIEFSLFIFILYLNYEHKLLKSLVKVVVPAFILFSAYFYFDSARRDKPIDDFTITVEYIIVIIFCLFYFFQQVNNPAVTLFQNTYNFWLIIGILIYSAGTFFFFMQAAGLSDEEWDRYTIINHVFTIIKNLLFAVALFKYKRPPTSTTLVHTATY